MPKTSTTSGHWAKAREQYANELTACILRLAVLAGPAATSDAAQDFRDGGSK